MPLLLLQSGVWEGPFRLPLLISLASLLCPQGPTQTVVGLESRGSAWELSRRVGGAVTLCSFSAPPRGPLPPASSDLPGLPPMPSRTHVAWREVWRAGDQPGSSEAPCARVGRTIALCSSPAPPGWPLPPATPNLPSLPPMPPGPSWPGWGFVCGAGGTGLGAQQAPRPPWARRSPSAPLLLFAESLSHLPLLIFLASGVPVLSGLHFSSHLGPPTSYLFTLGFLPSPWGLKSPTSG